MGKGASGLELEELILEKYCDNFIISTSPVHTKPVSNRSLINIKA